MFFQNFINNQYNTVIIAVIPFNLDVNSILIISLWYLCKFYYILIHAIRVIFQFLILILY